MNGTNTTPNAAQKVAKPPPAGPAPPAPLSAPPAPPTVPNGQPVNRATPAHSHAAAVNGIHGHNHNHKGKKKAEPVDPAVMYESVRNRIAALEEAEVHGEEEEKQIAEEANKSVKGLEENAIHSKYIELFAELKRVERDHAKEKQKLVKDKDAAKSQLTKANQTKTKMENLARELQKENKRLRDDSKRLTQSVEEAQDEILQLKSDMTKRAEKVKVQEVKFRDSPDIVVKVVCKYRAELYFKISRKTKLSRLFNAWTERMELNGGKKGEWKAAGTSGPQVNGTAKSDAATTNPGVSGSKPTMQFIFSHCGRTVEADQTPEEAGMEDGDEILAVELMDLTIGPGVEDTDDVPEVHRQTLKKNWTDNPREAKKALNDLFDGVVRERLKEVLRQYELRERHFECVVRSKELEVLLSRARAAEQKQLAESEKARAQETEEESQRLRKELEDTKHTHNRMFDKLMLSCKEVASQPTLERIQRLSALVREEDGKSGVAEDGPVG